MYTLADRLCSYCVHQLANVYISWLCTLAVSNIYTVGARNANTSILLYCFLSYYTVFVYFFLKPASPPPSVIRFAFPLTLLQIRNRAATLPEKGCLRSLRRLSAHIVLLDLDIWIEGLLLKMIKILLLSVGVLKSPSQIPGLDCEFSRLSLLARWVQLYTSHCPEIRTPLTAPQCYFHPFLGVPDFPWYLWEGQGWPGAKSFSFD